jgi:purine-binding chemotaxis protein CheW
VSQKLVCFTVGGQELGIPIRAVKETIPLRPVTRVFLVPPFVAGLINLRGEVVAVLELARLLGLETRLGADLSDGDQRRHPDAAIVILRAPEGRGGRGASRAACGLLVERLHGVKDIGDETLHAPPPTLQPEAASYLTGVATSGEPRRPLLVIDPEKVIGTERLRPFKRVRAAATT